MRLARRWGARRARVQAVPTGVEPRRLGPRGYAPGTTTRAGTRTPGRDAPLLLVRARSKHSPAASVLAWNSSVEGRYGKLPLIAHHYAGRGKVLFVGTDSTWAWRQNVGDRFFYKFWGQGVRFVARRDEKAARQSWIEVRPVRAQVGEEAQVELMAVATDGTPAAQRTLPVQVSGTGEPGTLELSADPATKGRVYRPVHASGGGRLPPGL